jgi:pectinesterase
VLTVHGHFNLQGEFPSWIKSCDRMMLETSNVKIIDDVVALDGTGDSRKVMDAMLSAPKRSNKHFEIHVKRYFENVIIGQDKWNLMIIGDGMDVTVISGNLSSSQNHLTSYYTN